MRHKKNTVKFNRTSSHKNAMFKNMLTSLLKHGRIKTTTAKAKILCRWSDRVITLAKRGDLASRRRVYSIVKEKKVVNKLFDIVSSKFGIIKGGYTRVLKFDRRIGDNAQMSLVELFGSDLRST